MISIRPMAEEDIEIVSELEAMVFAVYWRRAGHSTVPARRHDNLRACLALNPGGCFVAVADVPVGFVFSRAWGRLGWIGTFGVHPLEQGRGIGRALLRAAAGQLQECGCGTVGLETMPESPDTVGFYLQAGLAVVETTLSLRKTSSRPDRYPPFITLREASGSQAGSGPVGGLRLPRLEAGLTAVRRLSEAVRPGLDYRSEADNAGRFGWGETLLIGEDEPWGLAIVSTSPRRQMAGPAVADVRVLAVDRGAGGCPEEALLAVEAFAVRRGLAHVSLQARATDRPELQRLVESGYRVCGTLLRLTLDGTQPPPTGLDWSRWTM